MELIRESKTVKGSAIVFGDLHLFVRQDRRRPTGLSSHKDYNANSRHNMRMVLARISEFQETYPEEPVTVFFLGDIFGVDQHVLTDNTQRLEAADFLTKIKDMTGSPALTVWGNHDRSSKQTSETELFTSLGLLENPSWVDLADSAGNIYWRWHFVNNNEYSHELPIIRHGKPSDMGFGADGKKLRRKTLPTVPDVANGVLGHNNYYAGEDMRPHPGSGCIDLTTLDEFENIVAVIYGDTHEPSGDGWYKYSLKNGSEFDRYAIGLGSPARTSRAQDYEDANIMWMVSPDTQKEQEGTYKFEVRRFGALPPEEVFLPKESLKVKDGDSVREVTQEEYENVRAILSGLRNQTMQEDNYKEAINNNLGEGSIPAEIAIAYVQNAREQHQNG